MLKKAFKLFFSLVVVATIFCSSVLAKAPYDTYTFSYKGDAQISPAAYTPNFKVSDFGEAGTFKSPEDILTDTDRGYILIADTGNNRIVIINQDYHSVAVIAKFVNNGQEDSLSAPQGIFITKDKLLYVADTANGRIVVFDSKFAFLRVIKAPDASILPDNYKYNPRSVAVDSAGRIFVVSLNTNMGVIALDKDGSFQGFIGAQRVSTNAIDLVWRSFMSDAQLARTTSYVPVEYSNLTIDQKGFIYVTSSQIDRFDLYSAVWSRSTSSSFAPVKKLSFSGTDVLLRNSFFPPVGDVNFDAYSGAKAVSPSEITSISLLKNGMYVLLDSGSNKLFTYDSSGNLLYAFGGTGEALGLYNTLAGVAFSNNIMYTLDSANASITVSKKTKYCDLIDEVIGYQENREYGKASKMWETVLSKNNNFDIAYLGIGKILLEQENYKEAMSYFKLIDNKNYYAKAFALNREKLLENVGILVLLIAIILILLLIKLFSFVGKYNERRSNEKARYLLKDELMYGLFTIFHPFKGYWGLKSEKRGSVKAATIFLFLTAFSSVFSSIGACYSQKSSNATVMNALASMVLPLLLWCVSNVCFTSLMDGNGKLKDIYIAVCYSTVPYILVTIPATLISHMLTNDELSLLSMVTAVAIYWMIALIFFGMMTVHDYTLGKNVIVTILTIAGMAFILFLILIFFSLSGRIMSLVASIINEIAYRS